MKSKKLIISILIILMIVSINSFAFAKYVFEYTIKVAEITINN